MSNFQEEEIETIGRVVVTKVSNDYTIQGAIEYNKL